MALEVKSELVDFQSSAFPENISFSSNDLLVETSTTSDPGSSSSPNEFYSCSAYNQNFIENLSNSPKLKSDKAEQVDFLENRHESGFSNPIAGFHLTDSNCPPNSSTPLKFETENPVFPNSSDFSGSVSLEGLHHQAVPRLLPEMICLDNLYSNSFLHPWHFALLTQRALQTPGNYEGKIFVLPIFSVTKIIKLNSKINVG